MENAPSESPPPDSDDRLSRDRLFELLSAKPRRYVVAGLQETSPPVTLDELARRIADGEPSADAPADTHDGVKRSLYHRHLPKLEDAGVVEHDREWNTVEPAANFEHVAELWDALLDAESSGSE